MVDLATKEWPGNALRSSVLLLTMTTILWQGLFFHLWPFAVRPNSFLKKLNREVIRPSAAEAGLILPGLMYGLKPVPFEAYFFCKL